MEFIGPPLEKGALPAVIYFSLSAHNSLHLDPFNQPAKALETFGSIRVFSFSLPLHPRDTLPDSDVIQQWGAKIDQGDDLISHFIDDVYEEVLELIDQGVILKERLGLMGLSRGCLIACLLARKLAPKALLGFAPLLHLNAYSERADHLDVTRYADELALNTLRFYMGNRDKKTSTKTCMDFILSLADHAYAKGKRSSDIELVIRPSIGYKGHGTAPETFIDGATWLKEQL